MSGGWSPTIHLASQAGAKAGMERGAAGFPAAEADADWIGAGAFTGSFSTAEAIAEGRAAGVAAAGGTSRAAALPDRWKPTGGDPEPGAGFRDHGQGQELRRLPA